MQLVHLRLIDIMQPAIGVDCLFVGERGPIFVLKLDNLCVKKTFENIFGTKGSYSSDRASLIHFENMRVDIGFLGSKKRMESFPLRWAHLGFQLLIVTASPVTLDF